MILILIFKEDTICYSTIGSNFSPKINKTSLKLCLFIYLIMCYKNNCCELPRCKDIPIKRYFLPLIGVFALAALPELRNFVYLPLIITFGFLILFWNFPWIVYYTASKPLYYQDLFIDEKKLPNYDVDDSIKYKFKMILETVLIISNALLTGALADYYLYKTTGNEGYIEIIGVTGGIIKIFQMINNTISRFMLKILKRCVRKENRDLKRRQIENIERIIRLKRHQSTVWKEIELTNQTENRVITRERAGTF